MNTSYWLGHLLFKCIGKAFVNRRVSGWENLLDDQGVLMCSNHESFVDPPFCGVIYDFQVAYLARKTLFKGVFKWIYESWDAIPIDQESHDMSSLKKIIKRLKDGDNVIMFPEGARTLDGNLQKGMPGVGLIIAKAGCKVQPVRIFGARDTLARGRLLPKRCQVDVVIGRPIEFTKEQIKSKGKEAYQWISDEIMREIALIQPPVGTKQPI